MEIENGVVGMNVLGMSVWCIGMIVERTGVHARNLIQSGGEGCPYVSLSRKLVSTGAILARRVNHEEDDWENRREKQTYVI